MCGITGWVDWRRDLRDQADVLAAMTRTMACRGPDDSGSWLSARAALGHRRLAIIDLEGGRQPMAAGSAVLTYSGELYNFTELRDELIGLGHRFKTRSDTEVVLHAYLEWGERCVQRFNGMYAFAIWDAGRDELLLIRDRLGIKPLYYHAYDGGLLFGSEPKALLANPLFTPELEPGGLAEIFAMFGGRTPGHGVLRGLSEVRPGCLVRVDRNGCREEQYWRLESRPHEDDEATTVATVRELLADTVRRQLVSDVPLCVLVSGGLDSSVLGALAAQATGGDLSTFSVDFRGSAESFAADANRPELDAPYALRLAEHIGSRHTPVVVETPDLLAAMRNATRARDLPCLGDLDGSLYLLFEAIRGRSTVALSGESADEVFGGYRWFHDEQALGRPAFPWAPGPTGFGEVLAPEVKKRVQPGEYLAKRYAEALAEVPILPGESGVDARMREVSYLALTRHLPMLLDRKDRMSMAVGLEVRVPFCDHRLVEYVWNIPWAMKNLGGVPKGLLRAAAADLMPAELAQRPKSMFPVAADHGYDGAVRDAARKLVTGDSAVRPLIDAARVHALADGATGRPAWMVRLALAYLVQVDEWLRTYDVRISL